MADKNTSKNNENKKSMSKKEKLIYTIIIVILIIAIVMVSVLFLYPKLAGRPDWHIKAFFDFNDSTWIEDMVNRRLDPKEKMLDISSQFVYSEDSAFITVVYGSGATISEAKQYYLDAIPGSVDYKEDSVSQMQIAGELNGEEIEVINYEADVLNAYDVKVTLNEDMAVFLKERLEEAFPQDVVASYPELAAIIKNSDMLGGYVKYNDDELSSSSYVGVPIYSRAYRYAGTKEDLIAIQRDFESQFPDSLYFEDIDTVYFMDNGHIISMAITESDFNLLAVITVQEIPKEELAKMQEND